MRAPQAAPTHDVASELLGLAASATASPEQPSEDGSSGDTSALAPRGAGTQTQSGQGTSDEVEVDYGGARRRVSLKELAKKAQEHDSALQKAALAEEMFAKNATAAAFIKAVDAMDPEDQRAFAEVVKNPKLARSLLGKANGQPQAPQEASDDDIDEIVNGSPRSNGHAPPDRIATLERAVHALLQDRQSRIQGEEKATMAQRVEQTMGSFPVFGESEAGAKFARQAILTKLAANPSLPMDDVVAEHATQLHSLLQEQRSAAMPSGGVGRSPRPIRELPNLEGDFTAADLMSGRIGKSLLGR